ncbi:MAG: hypothetical protein HFE99_07505 [Ruminiclostridium sp.]|jgi:hypothetical protein|nr:hypothetical protein [Ruminiclostridium sp.]
MKKKVVLTALTFLMALTLVGPAPAFALSERNSTPSELSIPLSDEFIVYYMEKDGITYYRVWNATDLRWETPWLPCK